MKALVILAILFTFGIIFFLYYRNRDTKKLLISLVTIAAIITLAVLGNLTRQVFPIYIAHIILITVSWGALILYIVRERYYWWVLFSPVVTIGLFLLLELVTGSSHELL